MTTLALVVLATFVFGAAYGDEATITNRQERQSDFKPIYGVASVAGITSRNGKVSTTGGIHFYPAPVGAIGNGNGFYEYNPLTFTKAMNGKYASGSVQIQPGAVVSSAQAGYIEPGLNPWPLRSYLWPIQNNLWSPQNQLYTSAAQRVPWYNHMNFDTQSRDAERWLYPSFNPFLNLWR